MDELLVCASCPALRFGSCDRRGHHLGRCLTSLLLLGSNGRCKSLHLPFGLLRGTEPLAADRLGRLRRWGPLRGLHDRLAVQAQLGSPSERRRIDHGLRRELRPVATAAPQVLHRSYVVRPQGQRALGGVDAPRDAEQSPQEHRHQILQRCHVVGHLIHDGAVEDACRLDLAHEGPAGLGRPAQSDEDHLGPLRAQGGECAGQLAVCSVGVLLTADEDDGLRLRRTFAQHAQGLPQGP
mmetsp:Transcript_40564/g.117282  ORF Transcript_40564/g.117282 Transcript_40564/m.117282 type:complete len:238 (+) Transcript_40564:467-1180(+)